jgi:putative SOS response-associated peptidase YedK
VCGRYTNTTTREQLAEHFPEVADLAGDGGFERFNIAPTQEVVALTLDKDGERTAARLRWGLIPHWSMDRQMASKLTNARSETVAEKPSFRSLVKTAEARALVLADGYYEWIRPEKRSEPRTPMHYRLADGRPFAFAGLWTSWRDPDSGEKIRTCTLLTTQANALAAAVHHRMPVILADAAARAAWLDPSLQGDDVAPLFAPLADELLCVAPANPLVNSARNEGARLLAPDSDQLELSAR